MRIPRARVARFSLMVVIALSVFGAGAPASAAPTTAAPAQTDFWYWIGETKTRTNQRIAEYRNSGFRIASLSFYHDSGHFAVTWIKRAGPDYQVALGVTQADLIEFHDRLSLRGYQPTIVSAIGSGPNGSPNIRYSLVMERTTVDTILRYHMGAGEFDRWNRVAQDQDHILRSLSIYGAASSPLYAFIHTPNTRNIVWRSSRGDTYREYQTRFNDWKADGYYPELTVPSAAGEYAGVWHKRNPGPWAARHGLTAEDIIRDIERNNPYAWLPRHIHCAGAGSAIRCTSLLVTDRYPFVNL